MWADMKDFFNEHTGQLLTNLILPHTAITNQTVEMFKDETPLFI